MNKNNKKKGYSNVENTNTKTVGRGKQQDK
jgi:hypothetical protein